MLFQAIGVLKNINYDKQETIENLYWLECLSLGLLVGLFLLSLVCYFDSGFDGFLHGDTFYFYVIISIITCMIGNYSAKIHYEWYLYWVKESNSRRYKYKLN